MKIDFLIIVIILIALNKSMGQEFTVDNGSQDLMFDSVDFQIVIRANEILMNESDWNRNDDRKCQDDISSNKYSLFCALYKASLDITGEYDHRKPGLQQLRWIINDRFRHRWENHRLMDFNNHPDTTFEEIKNLIGDAMNMIKQKIKEE